MDQFVDVTTALLDRGHVYVLIQDDTPIYVGQTFNLFKRISEHRRDKAFNRVMVVPCEYQSIDEVEAYWICKLQPRLNKKLLRPGCTIKVDLKAIGIDVTKFLRLPPKNKSKFRRRIF